MRANRELVVAYFLKKKEQGGGGGALCVQPRKSFSPPLGGAVTCLCVCADCINLESALRLSGRGSYLGTGTSGVAAQSTPTSHNNSSGASATATSNKTNLCRSGRSYNSFLLLFFPSLALN